MAEIISTKLRDRNLTVNVAQGIIAVEDILDFMKKNYGNQPTKYVLWELKDADISSINSKAIDKIIDVFMSYDK